MPIRTYEVRDGLAHNRINGVYQDRRGYLWFSTWEGLSRFDGRHFTNYGTRDGLSNTLINVVTEDRLGRIWVGTHGGGVARMIEPGDLDSGRDAPPNPGLPPERRRFRSYAIADAREAGFVYSVFFDSTGVLWCVTEGGLYRAVPDSTDGPRFRPVLISPARRWFPASFVDVRGRPTFVTGSEVVRIEQGRVVRWTHRMPDDAGGIVTIEGDGAGGWLLACDTAIFAFGSPEDTLASGFWRRIPIDLAPDQAIRSLACDPSGTLWIGTTKGLIKRAAGGAQDLYTRAQGLTDDRIRALFVDRDGSLWIGTHLGGVCRLSGMTILSFTTAEGLTDPNIMRVVEGRDGTIYASSERGGVYAVKGDRLVKVPGSEKPPFDRISFRITCDRRGGFWIGSNEGLYRFNGPGLQLRDGRKFRTADGIPEIAVFGDIYEDASGKVFLSCEDNAVYRFDPDCADRPCFRRFDVGKEVGAGAPRTFLAERSGSLWFAPFVGIWRLGGGGITEMVPSAGIPEAHINSRVLYQDRRGRLWVGLRFKGVSVTDEPAAAHPVFRNYSIRDGLLSDAVWGIAEDDSGRIYLGTGRGLEQLDPSTGRVRHYTSDEGLAGDLVNHCMKDSKGYIWVGTSGGLSRFDPHAGSRKVAPPPVYIGRIQVSGEEFSLPENGTRNAGRMTIPSSKSNILIEYVGIDFHGEEALRYQYRLEGMDPAWSEPTDQTSVHYGRLSAGSYRFLVRAVSEEGLASSEPAAVDFHILPPLWQRWWFLGLCAAALAGIVQAAHRARVRRILALERIRTQIATDLHDEVGSGLSQIAILSEVGKRRADPSLTGLFDEVAGLARSMRESMSDIVWSVDPRKDRLTDLIHRMRQVAWNLLESEGLKVDFRTPGDREIERFDLPPDRRRQLFLFFKEAATNVARHAGASEVGVEIEVRGGILRMAIADDGRGFDSGADHDGHGLRSFRRRAEELGGRLILDSTPGRGARVEILVPAHRTRL